MYIIFEFFININETLHYTICLLPYCVMSPDLMELLQVNKQIAN